MWGSHAIVVSILLCAGTAMAQQAPPPVDRSQFDAAFDAMVRGDFQAAAAGFHAVASSGAPELRAQALELANLADTYLTRGAHLTLSAAPGVTATATNEDDEPTGGRTTFITTTTIASLYSGIVLIDLLDVNDVRSGTAIVMGSTAAGVLGSIYGTRGRTITGGMADAWSLGLLVGAGNALLLSEPLGLYRSSTNPDKKVLSLTLGMAWGGAAAGLVVADRIKPTRAQVNVVNTFGLMGLGSTLLTLAIVQPSNLSGDTFTTITAVGLDGGLGVGAAFADKLDWSNSRARLVQLSAFLGAVAGGGTSLILLSGSNASDTAGRAAAAITLAGLWGGFALGGYLTRDMEPDYRFRRAAPSNVTLVPAVFDHGGGLAILGAI